MDERIICNKLNIRHAECRDVLQRVMQTSSKVMTLATKFGSYFLLGLLEGGESIPSIIGKDIFWRWCVEMVTSKTDKATTTFTLHKAAFRAIPDPERPEKDTEEMFAARCAANVRRVEEERRVAVAEKSIKRRLFDAWLIFQKLLPETFEALPRDFMYPIFNTYTTAYVTNLKVATARTLEPLRVTLVTDTVLVRINKNL
jgi:hypothetical protein